jgi:hypothetical protein
MCLLGLFASQRIETIDKRHKHAQNSFLRHTCHDNDDIRKDSVLDLKFQSDDQKEKRNEPSYIPEETVLHRLWSKNARDKHGSGDRKTKGIHDTSYTDTLRTRAKPSQG